MKNTLRIGWVTLVGLAVMFVLEAVFSYSAEVERGYLIRMVKADVEPQKEAEFNRWYNEEHEPLLRKGTGGHRHLQGQELR